MTDFICLLFRCLNLNSNFFKLFAITSITFRSTYHWTSEVRFKLNWLLYFLFSVIIKVAPHTLWLAETIAQLLMGIFAIETFMDVSKFPRVGGVGEDLGQFLLGMCCWLSPIIVYCVANYRPYFIQFWKMKFSRSQRQQLFNRQSFHTSLLTRIFLAPKSRKYAAPLCSSIENATSLWSI